MNSFKKTLTTFLVFCPFLLVKAQTTDSSGYKSIQGDTLPKIINWKRPENKKHFSLKSLLIPGAMIAYGFTSLGNDGLENLNQEFKEDLWTEHPHKLIHIDNYLLITPALSVYGLNALGIKGKNNFRDRTMIFLLSNIILNTTVFTIKKFRINCVRMAQTIILFLPGILQKSLPQLSFSTRSTKVFLPGMT